MEFFELAATDSAAYRPLAQASGAFLQDPDWGDFQASLGRDVLRFGVNDGGQPVGYMQTIRTRALNKKYLFAPYGPLFAESLDENRQDNAFAVLSEGIRHLQPGTAFIRVEPGNAQRHVIDSGRFLKSIDLNPHRTVVLDLNRSEDELSAAMKPKTRYNIKIAERDGVEVRVLSELPVDASGSDPLRASALRAGIRTYSRGYFNALLKFFSDSERHIQARCYAAYHDGDILAAVIIIFYGTTATYLFGGASGIKRQMMPNYLIHWQAIRDAKAMGCSRYDFWGVETDPKHPWYGFSTFKLGFGGRLESRPGTYDFVYNRAWYTTYNALRTVNRLKNAAFGRK